MLIIGCDFHTRYQQIAMAEDSTGELLLERQLLDQLEPAIAGLDRAVLQEAKRREDAMLLMTHPGIGPNTALAFVLAVGPVVRFHSSKKIASYFGLNPSEESSGGRRRLGAISKQGNTMVRWLLVETVHQAVRKDSELPQDYQRLKFRRGHAVAKVAIARKLAVRMYWMLRTGADYAQLVRRQGSRGAPWWTQVHRLFDWAPCSRERSRCLKNESWSEVGDRIDGWWNQIPPLDSRSEPWSK